MFGKSITYLNFNIPNLHISKQPTAIILQTEVLSIMRASKYVFIVIVLFSIIGSFFLPFFSQYSLTQCDWICCVCILFQQAILHKDSVTAKRVKQFLPQQFLVERIT